MHGAPSGARLFQALRMGRLSESAPHDKTVTFPAGSAHGVQTVTPADVDLNLGAILPKCTAGVRLRPVP